MHNAPPMAASQTKPKCAAPIESRIPMPPGGSQAIRHVARLAPAVAGDQATETPLAALLVTATMFQHVSEMVGPAQPPGSSCTLTPPAARRFYRPADRHVEGFRIGPAMSR